MPATSPQELAVPPTRFLSGHRPRSVRERLQAIVDSPLSTIKNDHYGRGGFVAEFEEFVAALLGKEAAVFMPSGTMAQPIALRIWADQSNARNVAFHPTCHLQIHEHLAYQALHGLNGILLGDAGRPCQLADLQVIEEPLSTVLLELPQREIGGTLPSWSELSDLTDFARKRGARLHLDGARLWECQPFYQRSYAEIVEPFDSVYVSFYKVLEGLPGAVLAGGKPFIEEARIWQRRQGGNLQQQSPSAIAAKLGLEEHLPRIPEYVAKAAEIAYALASIEQIQVVPERPPTNMMHLVLKGDPDRLMAAASAISAEEQVTLFFHLAEGNRMELTVGTATLEISTAEIAGLFQKLFQKAG